MESRMVTSLGHSWGNKQLPTPAPRGALLPALHCSWGDASRSDSQLSSWGCVAPERAPSGPRKQLRYFSPAVLAICEGGAQRAQEEANSRCFLSSQLQLLSSLQNVLF